MTDAGSAVMLAALRGLRDMAGLSAGEGLETADPLDER